MADLTAPANADRMLNALDRALHTHQSARSVPLPVLALGLWTEVPDRAPDTLVDTTAVYRTVEGDHEVVLDLDDPGGDGVAPIISTLEVRDHELATAVLRQSSLMHGAGVSMPVAPAGTEALDAELSGMTNRRHLLATAVGVSRQVQWHGDARTTPSELEVSHHADIALLAVGANPPPVLSDQPRVEGLLTLWFLNATRILQRNGIKSKQVTGLLRVDVKGGTTSEIGRALAEHSTTVTWNSLYDQFTADDAALAAQLNIGAFSRFLPAAEAGLYVRCKGPTISFLQQVVGEARDVSG